MTPHTANCPAVWNRRGGKLARTRAAALASNAVVVHKGPTTVVAAPDGRAAIATHAHRGWRPADRATSWRTDPRSASSGLRGWTAATAGVWLHGAAGAKAGPWVDCRRPPELLLKSSRTCRTPAKAPLALGQETQTPAIRADPAWSSWVSTRNDEGHSGAKPGGRLPL